MTERVFTDDDVTRIVATAMQRFTRELEQLIRDEADRPRVYTLTEVAEMTGMSWRWIADGCRSERLAHVHQGDFRGMTAAQINALIASRTEGGETAPSGFDNAVQMTRRNAARSGRRKTA